MGSLKKNLIVPLSLIGFVSLKERNKVCIDNNSHVNNNLLKAKTKITEPYNRSDVREEREALLVYVLYFWEHVICIQVL